MVTTNYVRWFSDIRLGDLALVGGKNASLGELYSTLSKQGVRVPNGFALTAEAYRDALTAAKAWERLHQLLDNLDKRNVDVLAKRATEAREIVYQATATGPLLEQIDRAYRQLETEYRTSVAVAVRSSATAEDLPSASFAGQHESFLNVSGTDELFEACRRCFASIFTDRAISYRVDNGFDHFKVALSVGVMKMLRSDRAASGVTFTLDTESGFRDVVFVTGVYGLGENIVQGTVDPDEFYVHKPTFSAGHRAVLSRSLGRKQLRMIYADRGGGTRNVPVSEAERERFCIADVEVLKLAGDAIRIEDHYSKNAGHPMPMDIEWAKDGDDGQLYIIQARPETVVSQRMPTGLEIYALGASGTVLALKPGGGAPSLPGEAYCPPAVRETFIRVFTEGLLNPDRRVTEGEWQNLFSEMKDSVIPCSVCKAENFFVRGGECWHCHARLSTPPVIVFRLPGCEKHLAIFLGTTIRRRHIASSSPEENGTEIIGTVVPHSSIAGAAGIRNNSATAWRCTFPDGSAVDVPHGRAIPLNPGTSVCVEGAILSIIAPQEP